MLLKYLLSKSVLSLGIAVGFLIMLSSCSKENYKVALYEDINNKEDIVDVYQSHELEVAVQNCQTAIKFHDKNDKNTGRTERIWIITGSIPVYYCRVYNKEICTSAQSIEDKNVDK